MVPKPGWFTPEQELALVPLIAKATSEGWEYLLRTRSDFQALLDGCWYDAKSAHRVEQFFVKFLRHSTGKFDGEPFVLLDWQRLDVIYPLFGWKTAEGFRRFRRAFVFVPKKNGKSTLCSGLQLYMLVGDGESSPEVYCCATDRKQAGIVFNESAKMVKKSAVLSGKLDIINSRRRITFEQRNGFISVLSADAATAEGINASLVIYDELHEAKNRKLYDILRFSGDARQQPLFIVITTAGQDTESICREEYQYAKKVRSGEVVDTSFLVAIYEAESEDLVESPETWRKANPSLGVTLSLKSFEQSYEEAKTSPQKMSNFRRRKLNQWVSLSADSFIDYGKWQACEGEFPDDLDSLPCWLGMDLGSTDDITALIQVWRGTGKIYVKANFWCPSDKVRERALEGRVPYLEWAQQGLLRTTPGARTDWRALGKFIVELADECQLREVAYDPWSAPQLVTELESEGLPMVSVPQRIGHLSPATKELEGLVLTKELVHDGNPVLAWMIGNAVAISDPNGNVRLDKKRSPEKIDGAAALVTALARALVGGGEDNPEPYNGVGFAIIGVGGGDDHYYDEFD